MMFSLFHLQPTDLPLSRLYLSLKGDIAIAAVYGRGMMYHLLSQMAEIYQI